MKENTMNKMNLFVMTLACGVVLASCSPVSGKSDSPRGERHSGQQSRKTPPPEAFEACNDLSLGGTCTVSTPKGEITGTCVSPKNDGDLVCAPAGRRPRR
jgi:hypothetical protein